MTPWTKNCLKVLFVIAACLSHTGCLTKFPYFSKSAAPQENEVEYDGASPESSQLGEKKTSEKPGGSSAKVGEEKKPPISQPAKPPAAAEKATEKRKPEEEAARVRTAALDLAKSLGQVERMKVCYSNKDKEWWAIFYQDIESGIDVKQFFWNSDGEKFEPFLVMKRIPKTKLEAEAKKDEPEKTCTVVTPPASKNR